MRFSTASFLLQPLQQPRRHAPSARPVSHLPAPPEVHPPLPSRHKLQAPATRRYSSESFQRCLRQISGSTPRCDCSEQTERPHPGCPCLCRWVAEQSLMRCSRCRRTKIVSSSSEGTKAPLIARCAPDLPGVTQDCGRHLQVAKEPIHKSIARPVTPNITICLNTCSGN